MAEGGIDEFDTTEENTGESLPQPCMSKKLNTILNDLGLSEKSVAQRRYNMMLINIAYNAPYDYEYGKHDIHYLSGSASEGLVSVIDQTSDVDIMMIHRYNIIDSIREIPLPYSFPLSNGIYEVEDSTSHVMFKRLKHVYGGNDDNLFQHVNGNFYLSHADIKRDTFTSMEENFEEEFEFISNSSLSVINVEVSMDIHGPSVNSALTSRQPLINCTLDFDQVITVPCPFWPNGSLDEWFVRTRLYQWPTANMVQKIKYCGCHLVGKGFEDSTEYAIEWRISFSMAENILIHSFNDTQFKCYYLMKSLLKREIKTRFPNTLCSYYIKTVMFWICEETDPRVFSKGEALNCFNLCVKKLISFLLQMNCPCYFRKDMNLFENNMTPEQCNKLIEFLSDFTKGRLMDEFIVYLEKHSFIYKYSYVYADMILSQSSFNSCWNEIKPLYEDSVTDKFTSQEIQKMCINSVCDLLYTSLVVLRLDLKCITILCNTLIPDLSFMALSVLWKTSSNNKTKYRLLKYYLSLMPVSLSVENAVAILKRATIYLKLGKMNGCMVLALNVIDELSQDDVIFMGSHFEANIKLYFECYFKHMSSLDRPFRFSSNVTFSQLERDLVPELIRNEMDIVKTYKGKQQTGFAYVDSIIYAISLVILCQHRLSDFNTRDEYLQQLRYFCSVRKCFLCYQDAALRILDYFQRKFISRQDFSE